MYIAGECTFSSDTVRQGHRSQSLEALGLGTGRPRRSHSGVRQQAFASSDERIGGIGFVSSETGMGNVSKRIIASVYTLKLQFSNIPVQIQDQKEYTNLNFE